MTQKEPKPELRLELSLRRAQAKLRDLVATEGSIFDSLKEKRVFFLTPSDSYTAVVSRHGLDFVEFKDVKEYHFCASQEEIDKYERGEESLMGNGYNEYKGSRNLRVYNKSQIEQICELDDFLKREEP